jgi:hypothetical protein
MGTRDSFPGGKAAGRETDHSPPSSAEVKNAWSHTSTPQYVFMAWYSVKKAQGQLYLYLYIYLYLYCIILEGQLLQESEEEVNTYLGRQK